MAVSPLRGSPAGGRALLGLPAVHDVLRDLRPLPPGRGVRPRVLRPRSPPAGPSWGRGPRLLERAGRGGAGGGRTVVAVAGGAARAVTAGVTGPLVSPRAARDRPPRQLPRLVSPPRSTRPGQRLVSPPGSPLRWPDRPPPGRSPCPPAGSHRAPDPATPPWSRRRAGSPRGCRPASPARSRRPRSR